MEREFNFNFSDLKAIFKLGPFVLELRKEKDLSQLEEENLRLRQKLEELEAEVRRLKGDNGRRKGSSRRKKV